MKKHINKIKTSKSGQLILATALSLSCANVAFASEKLTLTQKVDEIFTQVVDVNSPGCAVGIYQNNKMLYSQGYGLANVENNVKITPKSVFDIGSTSKQFTAASIIKLQQKGKLSLDDDIRQYLPEMPQYEKVITIRHLLNHTSGLRDFIDIMLLSGFDIDDVTTDEDALNILIRQKSLNFTPGTKYLYSNTGYFLASLIVERTSGKTLKDFSQQYLFTPLEMSSSKYINSHTELVKNRAVAYGLDENNQYIRNVSYWEQNGDGAVFTTVEDLLRWDKIFYSDEEEYSQLTNLLLTRGKLTDGSEISYAHGLFHSTYKGLELVEHAGSWGGYRAQLARVPAHHFSVATLCNFGEELDPRTLSKKILEVYLESHIVEDKSAKGKTLINNALQAINLGDDIYQSHVGKYEFVDHPGLYIELTYQDNVFTLSSPLGTDIILSGASDTVFINQQGKNIVEFILNSNGTLQNTIMYHTKSNKHYNLKKLIPHTLSEKYIQEIMGKYHSEELSLSFDIDYVSGTFIASDQHQQKIKLANLAQNRYLLVDEDNSPQLAIQRDESGVINGFSLSTYGAKNVHFVKIK